MDIAVNILLTIATAATPLLIGVSLRLPATLE